MKRSVSLLLTACLFSLVALNPQLTYAKGFKKYRIKTKNAQVDFVDENFGHFGEKCHVVFQAEDGSRNLLLRVWRELEPDETAPALNILRVRIYGYDSVDRVVHEVEVEAGFRFERNVQSEWVHEFEALPKKAKKLTIIFIGNYQSE